MQQCNVEKRRILCNFEAHRERGKQLKGREGERERERERERKERAQVSLSPPVSRLAFQSRYCSCPPRDTHISLSPLALGIITTHTHIHNTHTQDSLFSASSFLLFWLAHPLASCALCWPPARRCAPAAAAVCHRPAADRSCVLRTWCQSERRN